jgi:WD40 repeat protein
MPAAAPPQISFSADGKRLVTGGDRDSGVVKVWDVTTRKLVFSLKGHGGKVRNVAFSPDGRWIAISTCDPVAHRLGGGVSTLRLWDGRTGKRVRSLVGHRSEINTLAFSPDSKLLASGSGQPT